MVKKSFVLILLFASINFPQPKEDITYLKNYAGEYTKDQLLADKNVNPSLKKLLGKDYTHLINNLDVAGAIDLISGGLVISGNAPHNGGEEMGIVDINLYTGNVRAAIYSNNKIFVYGEKENYEYLPISIKDWIAVVNTKLSSRFNKPQNVILK